ncbi:MAG TPA: DUF3795 domain-containing protein [Terriglobales bacterium]|nr:DUF3795 domain-containing protein [Terriglobales bacterium]
MSIHMSACGVICSECPAYRAREANDPAERARVAQAWHELFDLSFTADQIPCGGCLGPHEDVFCTSRECAARRCCLARGLASCAECPDRPCPHLERAQSNWDGLESRAESLPVAVFREFFLPYCHARDRVPSEGARP